jgi:hypothetical protein
MLCAKDRDSESYEITYTKDIIQRKITKPLISPRIS